jgi:hypothetical protein
VTIPVGICGKAGRLRYSDGLANLDDDRRFGRYVRVASKVIELEVVEGVQCRFDPITRLVADEALLAKRPEWVFAAYNVAKGNRLSANHVAR